MEWIQGNDAGAQLAPVRKLLLHTTEGSSIEGAVAAYQTNNSWPHETVDYRFGYVPRRMGHLTADRAARSLKNRSGGVETNRDGVYQIEVVGFSQRHNEINWERLAREILGPLCVQNGIPIVSTVTWVAYPASYGEQAAQRLSAGAWDTYEGFLGHQHAPENDHGDPGDIPINAILSAAKEALPKPPPPQEDEDMPYYIRNGVNGAAYRIGVGAPVHQQSISAYQADLKVFKQIDYSNGADCDAHLAAATTEWSLKAGMAEDTEAILAELTGVAVADTVTDPDPS